MNVHWSGRSSHSVPTTIAGVLICRWAKTPHKADRHKLPTKAKSSKIGKWVACIITTNAGSLTYDRQLPEDDLIAVDAVGTADSDPHLPDELIG